MDRADDVEFLEAFRGMIAHYLFLGYAPAEGSVFTNEGVSDMRERLEDPQFRELRKRINETKPRAHDLLNECDVPTVVTVYPPPAIGGPIIRVPLFDLVTQNRLYKRMGTEEFADKIDQAIGVLKTNPPSSATRQLAGSADRANDSLPSYEVFIVHGHDELNTLKLKDLLRERWDIETIILSSKPGRGRTLIEKFEQEAPKAGFAIVLFTPDDFVQVSDTNYFQARPNVIFEIGWFYGRLGRDKVCILFKKGTSIPSDLDGINRIEFGDSVHEKALEIESELKAAGLLTG